MTSSCWYLSFSGVWVSLNFKFKVLIIFENNLNVEIPDKLNTFYRLFIYSIFTMATLKKDKLNYN